MSRFWEIVFCLPLRFRRHVCFSNRLIYQLNGNDGKARDATSGAQFAALPLVKPAVWFLRTVVNWRSPFVAESAFKTRVVTRVTADRTQNCVQPP